MDLVEQNLNQPWREIERERGFEFCVGIYSYIYASESKVYMGKI
jgi:hypothetical protein